MSTASPLSPQTPHLPPLSLSAQTRAQWRAALLLLLAASIAASSLFVIYGAGAAGGPVKAALLGLVAAALLKFTATRRMPNPQEALADGLVIVILALAADPGTAIWQVPTQWAQLGRITPLAAGSAALAHFLLLGLRLLRTRRHPSVLAQGCLIGVPFLFNWLLVLQSPPLTAWLADCFVPLIGAPTWQRDFAATAIVLAAFNETVAQAANGLLVRAWLTDRRAHALLIGCALFAAATPAIANVGSSPALAGLFWPLNDLAAVAAIMLAQAGLWAETYLITGFLMDGLRGRRPTGYWGDQYAVEGMAKGAVYSAIFFTLILIAARLAQSGPGDLLAGGGVAAFALLGIVVMPLLKTLMESFDGSDPFFTRLSRSYRAPRVYVRGIVVGGGFALGMGLSMAAAAPGARFGFGCAVGALAYAGVDMAWDALSLLRPGGRRMLQSWRVYVSRAALGGFVGGAVAWYLDTPQSAVILAKFHRYATLSVALAGEEAHRYVIYPLFSKWGAMDLGMNTGGVRLLYAESVSGVINWALAAPLFSVNLVFLTALFARSMGPVRQLFSREGMVGMAEQTVRVLRWGLWMAPVIYSFLRIAPDPTWYNQDGAVRTLAAIYQSMSMSSDGFRSWSIETFMYLLAYDWFRILIWLDHMGLRVATLVNLSFVGGDALDEALARWQGHPGRARCIPEGLRRFATWAPLLIPFFLPMGNDWNYVWDKAEAIEKTGVGQISGLSVLLAVFLLGAACAVILYLRGLRRPATAPSLPADAVAASLVRDESMTISNGVYTVVQMRDGRGYSRVFSGVRKGQEMDLTRRPEHARHVVGKFLYVMDADAVRETPDSDDALWSLGLNPTRRTGAEGDFVRVRPLRMRLSHVCNGIGMEAEISLPLVRTAEVWKLTITNYENRPRRLELATYRELNVNHEQAMLRHPFYNRLHLSTRYVDALQAVFARNRLQKGKGRMSREVFFHAAKVKDPACASLLGWEDSRPRFIGSATLRRPESLFAPVRHTGDLGTRYAFDPVASLRIGVTLAPNQKTEILLVDGYAPTEAKAAQTLRSLLRLPLRGIPATHDAPPKVHPPRTANDFLHPAPNNTFAFSGDGDALHLSWDTPRRWAHLMANPLGYGALASNEGCIASFMGNSQQNGITPFPPDSMTAQDPGQVIYLKDTTTGQTMTPTFVPLRDRTTSYDVTYGLGYAVFRTTRPELYTEMTAFVPPDMRAEVRLLRLCNRSDSPRTFQVTPYCQIMLGEVPSDSAGQIADSFDPDSRALFFTRKGHEFHRGYAFVATSLPVDAHETVMARFMGLGRDVADPFFVAQGHGDPVLADDGYRVAALAGTLTVPAGGEASMCVVIGQEADMAKGRETIRRLCTPKAALAALAHTKAWWVKTLSVLQVETDSPAFDRLVNHWLPYQVLTARLWGRLGPQQRSGAFGYRDQLQDVLPLVALRPETARAQILKHARQQFLFGDVMQWWHDTWEGKTGLGMRNRAADPHLWLPYVTSHYVDGTGDAAILDARLPYLEGRLIPRGAEGIAFVPRVTREKESLYEHCLRAIDFSLARRSPQGLPLMGTGDWNDGLSMVGQHGKGASVWLGFFLYDVLRRFMPLVAARGDRERLARYQADADALRRALDAMWRDGRYARAVTDDGQELVFADALCSSWPILSEAAAPEATDKGRIALENGLRDLELENMILLLRPSFDEKSSPYPGRIADYPPGVRENGGQYSHGCTWLVDALARLAEAAMADGDAEGAARWRERALTVWLKISPLAHATSEDMQVYGLPPHQQAADISWGPGYEGRGGWSWYTGAAGRMLCAAQAMLGLRLADGVMTATPNLAALADPEVKSPLRVKSVRYKGKEILPRPE